MSDHTVSTSGNKGHDRSPMAWIGRSGRRYRLTHVVEEGYVMAPNLLYALIGDDRIVWVGTAANLIEDQASRARYRRSASEGAELTWMAAPADELALMTLTWDLDGTRRGTDRDAA